MNAPRYDDTPPQAWRNGRGITRELHDGDGWRLSVATIDEPGQFSLFPGFRRILTVTSGFLVLDIEGDIRRLNPGDVVSFPGEALVHATEVKRPTIVVNVMLEE